MVQLIYIISQPLNNRDYSRYGVGYMNDVGITPLVIDAFDLFYKSKKREKLLSEKKQLENVLYVKSLKDLKDLLLIHKTAKVVLITPVCLTFYKIVSFINSLDMVVATIKVGSIPQNTQQFRSVKVKLTSLLNRKGWRGIIRKFYEKFLTSIVFKDAYLSYLFYGGVKSMVGVPRILSAARRRISVHTLDYDLFMKGSVKPVQKNYIVFIDQYLPHHTDLYLSSDDPSHINADVVDQYYYYLNKFFEKVEDKYKCKVVVSAHPRSNYVDKDSRYLGRDVVFGNTQGLIEHSNFSITYGSTAVNFAVLYSKPLMMINMNLFDRFVDTYDQELASAMSYELGYQPVIIDTNSVVLPDVEINKIKYVDYKFNHIKANDSELGLFWNVVLKNMFAG